MNVKIKFLISFIIYNHRYSSSLGSYQQIDDSHEVYLGDELADGTFHKVLVERTDSQAKVYLDFGKPLQDEAIAVSRYRKLDLDRSLFVGGSMQTGLRGVKSTINFEGCLRKFTLDIKSKQLKLLKKGTGTPHNVKFECPTVAFKPVTFIEKSDTCSKTLGTLSKANHYTGEFMFRTYAKEGTVLTWGPDNMKVNFKERYVEMVVTGLETLSVTFGYGQLPINSGLWIKVAFSIAAESKGLSLTVNGKKDIKDASTRPDFKNKLTVGGNFVGCVQDLKIDGQKYDLESDMSCNPRVQFNKCNVSDHCNPNPCLNEGVCKQEDLSFKCSCKPDYKGSVCQFCKYTVIVEYAFS